MDRKNSDSKNSFRSGRKKIAYLYSVIVTICVIPSALGQDQTVADVVTSEPAFMRFVDGGGDWKGQLQTAIASYQNDDGVQVDLVAAVHIADRDYYQQLNQYFDTRDAVLYELVAPENYKPTAESVSQSKSPVTSMQQGMKNVLDLSFQLEQIDYSGEQFIHADLDPASLSAAMDARQESMLTIMMKMMQADIDQRRRQAQDGEKPATPAVNIFTLTAAMMSDNQSQSFKYLFAKELQRSGGVLPGLEGSLSILADRNNKALEVLQRELQNGRHHHLSIFYGAAHMPGLERGVLAQGFQKTGQRWLTAWKIGD